MKPRIGAKLSTLTTTNRRRRRRRRHEAEDEIIDIVAKTKTFLPKLFVVVLVAEE